VKNLADCDECRAILRDFVNALGEVERLKQELEPGHADTLRLRLEDDSGTAGDLEDFTSLHKQLSASHFDNPRCPGFARAMQRMLAHYNRTGHYVSPRALLT
jgi:hypothetical protein